MSHKYPPRYKPSGLELIPTPRYDVKCSKGPKPGFVWLYQVLDRFVIVKSDNEKILTATAKNLMDLDAGPYSDQMQRFLIKCAQDGLSVPEALERVREHYGEPLLAFDCVDVNEAELEVRAAVASLK